MWWIQPLLMSHVSPQRTEASSLENKGHKTKFALGKAGYTMPEEQETKLQGEIYLVFGVLGPRICSLLFLVQTRTGIDHYALSPVDPLIIYGSLCNFCIHLAKCSSPSPSHPLSQLRIFSHPYGRASPHLLHHTFFPTECSSHSHLWSPQATF